MVCNVSTDMAQCFIMMPKLLHKSFISFHSFTTGVDNITQGPWHIFRVGPLHIPCRTRQKINCFVFQTIKHLQEQFECEFHHIYSTVTYTLWHHFAVISYLFVNLYGKTCFLQKLGAHGMWRFCHRVNLALL